MQSTPTYAEKVAERNARNAAVIAAYESFVTSVAHIELRFTAVDECIRTFPVERAMPRSKFTYRLACFLHLLAVDGMKRRRARPQPGASSPPETSVHPESSAHTEPPAQGAGGSEFTTVRYGKKRYPTDLKQSEIVAYTEDIINGLFWIDTRSASSARRVQERRTALLDAVAKVHAICDAYGNENYQALMALIDKACAPS